MAIEEILAAIDDEGRRSAEAITAEADEKVKRALSEARARGDTERSRLSGSRDDAAATAAARIVNRARLTAEREIRASRDELYAEAHRRMLDRLGEVRDRADYGELLGRLVDEARSVLPEAGMLLVDPRDVTVTESMTGDLKPPLTVHGDLHSLGGVELVTGDGRRVRNTLESRADKAGPALRRLAVELIPQLGGTRDRL